MVGGDVQQNSDPRVECLRPLKLETADFHNRPVRMLRKVGIADQRRADVPADPDLSAGRLKHLTGQRGDRRLSVRAGDGDDRSCDETRGKFEFAQHRDPTPDSLDEDRIGGGNPRRRNDQIRACENLRSVRDGRPFRGQIFQCVPGLSPDRLGLCIGDGHPDPPTRQKSGCRKPRLSDAQNRRFFPVQIHPVPFTSVSTY